MTTVDIVIPTRNRLELTLAAARSVQRQTFPDWRLWIVDDGSEDAIREGLTRASTDDPRVTVISRVHAGPQDARANGVQQGSAPWIAFLDSDDLWLDNKLKHQLAIAGNLDLVLCWHEWFRPDNSVRSSSRPRINGRTSPLLTNNLSIPLIRRTFLDRIGGTQAPSSIGPVPTCDHIELYLRLLPEARVGIVPSVLVRCRDHTGTRNSDANASRLGAQQLSTVVNYNAPTLQQYPRENAALLSQVAARMMASGVHKQSVTNFARALRAASIRQRGRLIRRYMPFMFKSFVLTRLRLFALRMRHSGDG